MSTSKRIRLVLAVLVIAISVTLLVWAFAPMVHDTRVIPIDPGKLQLPTPEAWLPLIVGMA